MAERGRFEFFDEWRLAAEPATVWPVIRNVEGWPDWWPSVRSVVPVIGRSTPTWEFRFHTRLPYEMVFAAELDRNDSLLAADARVSGRVDGNGRCAATPIEGGTLVRFDWWVRPQVAWMRAVAPLARPAFSWNHRSLMDEGGRALARRLGTRLLADPLGALLPASRPTA